MADQEDMRSTDERRYLQTVQYRDSSNLARRISLHDRFSLNRYGFHPWVFDHFALSRGTRLLDVGCGSGQLWLRNVSRLPVSCSILLTDFSVGMVQDANTTLADDDEYFTYAVADVQCLPFDDGRFDAVVANHMLYCAQDRRAALAEIRRVLRRSGHLYASTNGLAHMRELGDLVRRFDPHYRLNTGWADRFGLENGREQLLEHFAAVDLHRYDDALVVTDAMALVEWAQSWAPGTFPAETRPDFYAHMEREGGKGAIRVGKDSGLFIATSQ